MTLKDALNVLRDVVTIAGAVSDAVAQGKPERVDQILTGKLRTSLAKAAADLRAEEKFRAH